MIVGIDVSQIVYNTGVSWYTFNLIKHLLEEDKNDEFKLFAGTLRQKPHLQAKLAQLSTNYHSTIIPLPPVVLDLLWNKIHLLSPEMVMGKVDIFHTSDWAEPPIRCPKVTTIHDLSAIIYPETAGKDLLRNIARTQKQKYEWVKKDGDYIISVSESTKKDIVERLGIDENKIKVVYEAPDAVYKKASLSEIEKTKEKYGIKGDYVLSVGVGKRKNLNMANSAVLKLDKYKLTHVIVGHTKPDVAGSYSFAKSPSNTEIASLYSGASALLYISSYEGFGLPILEAFACETPVVTSNCSSMPEISGGASYLVDPKSVSDITEGLESVVKNRDKYVELGKDRVKDFSWGKTARETINYYKEIIAK